MPLADDLGVADVLEVVSEVFEIEGEVKGDEYRFLCPVHQDNDPSCDVNLVTGLWSCFSCGAKGDLASLGSVVLKKQRDEVVGLLKPGTPDAILASIQRKVEKTRALAPRTSFKERGIDPRNKHSASRYDGNPYPYMKKRKFTKATCRSWGLRYTDETILWRYDESEKEDVSFTIKHSVCIPVKDARGKMLAWCYRATDQSGSWQPKYLYTPKFDLSSTWFGLDHVEPGADVTVVEGPMDAMWLWQCGIPALAMMGSNHQTGTKFRMLERFGSVTVLGDYDAGGAALVNKIGSLLRGRVPCKVARYPKQVVRRSGKEAPDPQDLSPEDVRLVVNRAIPWSLFQMRREGLTAKKK